MQLPLWEDCTAGSEVRAFKIPFSFFFQNGHSDLTKHTLRTPTMKRLLPFGLPVRFVISQRSMWGGRTDV